MKKIGWALVVTMGLGSAACGGAEECSSEGNWTTCKSEETVRVAEQSVLLNPPKNMLDPYGNDCGYWGENCSSSPGGSGSYCSGTFIRRYDEHGWYSTCAACNGVAGCCTTRDGKGCCDGYGTEGCAQGTSGCWTSGACKAATIYPR